MNYIHCVLTLQALSFLAAFASYRSNCIPTTRNESNKLEPLSAPFRLLYSPPAQALDGVLVQ